MIAFRAGASVLALVAMSVTSPVLAQSTPQTSASGRQAAEAEEEIVVVGQRPRGTVAGDIKPELQLNAGDVRALGVSSVTDLLAELAPQLQSGRGGSPLVLLEGRRVSSFREIATIPSEAIARVDILPEEVALRYGRAPDQKVMNIVLRARFKATTAEVRDRITTDGGGNLADASFDILSIAKGSRTNLSAEYSRTASLTEGQRGITDANGNDTRRTLLPSQRQFTVNASHFHPLTERLSASINGEVTTGRTLASLGPTVPTVLFPYDSLSRDSGSQSYHLGAAVNHDGKAWRSTLTASFDHDDSRSFSDRTGAIVDIARGRSDAGVIDFTTNGAVARLPAGDVSMTVHAAGSFSHFRSSSVRAGVPASSRLSRSAGLVGGSVDMPLFDSPAPWVGKLSVNGNGEVQSLSDAGTIRTYGFGFNWTPVRKLELIGSLKQAERAPTVQQLGNAATQTPGVSVYDYVTGQSALVQRINGGNAALRNQDQRDWRIGLSWAAAAEPDIRLSLDYNATRIENAIQALPALSSASEAAFPGRFLRDAGGRLIQLDARPVNIAQTDSSVLRWGFNVTKRLKVSEAQREAMRAAFRQRFPGGMPGASGSGAMPHWAGGSGGGGGHGGFGGGGGGFGGGRVNFAIYHSIRLTDSATLTPGQPRIDLLNGGLLDNVDGNPRHEIEVQTGYARNGLGVRLTGKWQSPSDVTDLANPSGNLHFSGLATVNLRLFANLGQIPKLVLANPWLRGTRVSVSLGNLFNQRVRVTDAAGNTPFAYRPGYFDPQGRTVMISLRKVFF